MKSKKLTDYTLEELLIRKNKVKMIYTTLGIFMLIALAILCYLAFTTKNMGLFAVAIGSLWAFIPGLFSLAALNKEIKTRQNSI